MKAVQLLLASKGDEELSTWSDEDLEKERKRLLEELKSKETQETKIKARGHVLDEKDK